MSKKVITLDSPYDHVATEGPFSWDELFESRRDFPEEAARSGRVCVVGGGIAGLCAAYELSRRGFSIKLLEASDRCGGRILTHRFDDGTYGELGAMRIPVTHQATLDYVERFGLTTRPFISSNPNGFFLVGKQHGKIKTFGDAKASDIGKLRKAYPNLTLTHAELKLNPFDLLLKKIVHPILRPLTDAERWGLFVSAAPAPSAVASWEQHSLQDYVTRELAEPLSEHDWAYIARATGLLYLAKGSFSQFVLDLVPTLSSPMVEIVGGMEMLPQGFLRRLGGQMIELGSKVTSVNIDETGVAVTWKTASRSPSKESFDYLVCTVPLTQLQMIEFRPSSLDGLKSKEEAWREVTTEPLAKCLFHCSRRFWETDYKIFGGKSFTDEAIQQCYYPSDNGRRERSATGANRWDARDPELSEHAGVFTAAYMWGKSAQDFADLQDEDHQTQMVLEGVDAIHRRPRDESVKKLVADCVHHSWRPGFTYFRPGEQERYQRPMREPMGLPARPSRVFFAGEHLAIMHGWILSSIVTALAAVRDVVKASDSVADRADRG
jgi:monoamine oxidase